MFNWKKTILNQSASIKEAIQVLNDEALHIVLVVDDAQKLIGTVTDGDIRRGLMLHLTLDTIVSEIMFTEPTVAGVNDGHKYILQKMNELGIMQIPIVDAGGKIVGLETLQILQEKKRSDNPVVLMAGGFGKRLEDLTEHIPKPMLNVGSQPILEIILKQFIDAGFHHFFISTHFKAKILQDHFGDGSDWDVSIQYIHEEKPLGTAGVLGLLPKNLPNLPIILMNGDLLTKVDFLELLSFHRENDGDATICGREHSFQVPYGVIKMEGHCIKNIVEKPVHKFFINSGIYVLNPDFISMIDVGSYLDMPQLLSLRINENKKINMFPLHEYWLDIGQKEQFNQAQIDIQEVFK